MADWFTRSFGDAVEDIRGKLIDEGWFGRKAAHAPSHDDHEPSEVGRNIHGHDHERGIDR